jgi:hypothetical protein
VGQARGAEGQECKWVPVSDLLSQSSNYQFPEANTPILEKLASTRPQSPA